MGSLIRVSAAEILAIGALALDWLAVEVANSGENLGMPTAPSLSRFLVGCAFSAGFVSLILVRWRILGGAGLVMWLLPYPLLWFFLDPSQGLYLFLPSMVGALMFMAAVAANVFSVWRDRRKNRLDAQD